MNNQHNMPNPQIDPRLRAAIADRRIAEALERFNITVDNIAINGTIMDMIGGPRFGIMVDLTDEEEESVEQVKVPLSQIAISSGDGFANFAAAFEEQEKIADRNYVFALEELRQALIEQQEQGNNIQAVFLTQTFADNADEAITRIRRLAQDLKIVIFFKCYDRDDDEDYYQIAYPPTAESIEHYWEGVKAKASPTYPKYESPVKTFEPHEYFMFIEECKKREFTQYFLDRLYALASTLDDQAFEEVVELIGRERLFEFTTTILEDEMRDVNNNTAFCDPFLVIYERLTSKTDRLIFILNYYERIIASGNFGSVEGNGNAWHTLNVFTDDFLELQFLLDEGVVERVKSCLRSISFTGNKYYPNNVKRNAREVLGSLQDNIFIEKLLEEMETTQDANDTDFLWANPLAQALKGNEELKAKVILMLEELLSKKQYTLKLNALVVTLLRSNDPSFLIFITDLIVKKLDLEKPDAKYVQIVILPILLKIKGYFMRISAEGEDLSFTQDSIEKLGQLMELLTNMSETQQGKMFGIANTDEVIADALLSLRSPFLERALNNYVFKVFSEGGYLIQNRDFVQLYLAYREIYGDIDAVSARIVIE